MANRSIWLGLLCIPLAVSCARNRESTVQVDWYEIGVIRDSAVEHCPVKWSGMTGSCEGLDEGKVKTPELGELSVNRFTKPSGGIEGLRCRYRACAIIEGSVFELFPSDDYAIRLANAHYVARIWVDGRLSGFIIIGNDNDPADIFLPAVLDSDHTIDILDKLDKDGEV